MRICLPIIAIILTICCRLASNDWADGPRQMQPPASAQVLADAYACAARPTTTAAPAPAPAPAPTSAPAAAPDDAPADATADAPSHETCNFPPAGICPLSERP